MRDTTEYQVSGAGCFSKIDAKAPSVALDALKEHEWCGSSSDGAKCGVGDLSGVADSLYKVKADDALDAVQSLAEGYKAIARSFVAVSVENRKLREQVAELMDESRELADFQEKVRGLLNESQS